jgi:hypothetical protein
MSHSDTVVYGYRIELGGEASKFFYLGFHQLTNLVQMNVTRHELRKRVDYSDNRFAELFVFHTIGAP